MAYKRGRSYEGTPEYAQSDHAQIVGYTDTDGVWRYVTDDDWRPPTDDDLAQGDKYLIGIDTSAKGVPSNMPGIVLWMGPIDPDGIDLQDVYDYYVRGYQSLAE